VPICYFFEDAVAGWQKRFQQTGCKTTKKTGRILGKCPDRHPLFLTLIAKNNPVCNYDHHFFFKGSKTDIDFVKCTNGKGMKVVVNDSYPPG
jgi:hypothetical protein